MAFARGSISITEKKRYVLLLFINANLVPDTDPIEVVAEENPFFVYFPGLIRFSKNEANEKGLITKHLTIEGLLPSDRVISLTAKAQKSEAEAFVRVVNEVVLYPQFGFEFMPDHYVFQVGKESHLKLIFDPEIFPLGSMVELSITSKEELLSDVREYIITDDSHVSDNTGCLKIPFVGGKSDTSYTVTASSMSRNAKAHIRVRDKAEEDIGKSGFLSKIQLDYFPDLKWQSSFRESDGTLFINASHPINKAILGDLRALDRKKPDFKPNQLRYIFELISAESARRVAKNEFADFPPSSVNQVLDFLQTEKTNLYCFLLPEMD
jgi:hypothetical protein